MIWHKQQLFAAGADKISLNTAAVQQPEQRPQLQPDLAAGAWFWP